jgi:CRP-like cAMP-binding protein
MAHDNGLLAGLPPDSLQRLHPRFEAVGLPRGHTLYDLGDPVRFVYFVTQGLVSLLALTPDGATLELASVGPEGLLGLPIIFGDRLAPYLATVQIAGTALRVPTDVFESELREHAALRRACLSYAHRAFAEIGQSAVCHHFHTVSERLCRWLLATRARLHTDTIEMTHESLAAVLGIPRTVVTRAVGELQHADAIRARHGRIEILHRRRLEMSACPCYLAPDDLFTLTPPPSDARRADPRPRRAS